MIPRRTGQPSTTPIAALLLALLLGSVGCGHRAAGPGAPSAAPIAAGPVDLEGAVKAQATAQAPDAVRVGPLYRGVAQGKGGRTEFHLQLDEGQCYWFSGVGGPGVEALGLYLWGSSYFRVASARSRGPGAVLMHCPKATGMYRLQGKVGRGAGPFAVGVYAKAAPPKPAPPPEEDLEALVEAEAASAAPGARRVGAFYGGESERNQWYTKARPGFCYWWVAVGNKEVKELSLFLFDPHRKRLDHNKSPARRVTLGHCPRQAGMFRLELKVRSGSGKYKVGVYRKAEEAATAGVQ